MAPKRARKSAGSAKAATPKSAKKQKASPAEASVAASSSSSADAAPVGADAIFSKYADPEDPDCMDMEGIGKLCEDLGLDAETDVRVLVLLWKLGAKEKPGELQRKEFAEGMEDNGWSLISHLKNCLPTLDPGFMDNKEFRDFYRFCFQFNREGTHRTLEKDLVLVLLPMVIADRSIHTKKFLSFLPENPITRITADQWNSFLEFSLSVGEDFTGYDEDAAWPLLMDEFVEWCQKEKK